MKNPRSKLLCGMLSATLILASVASFLLADPHSSPPGPNGQTSSAVISKTLLTRTHNVAEAVDVADAIEAKHDGSPLTWAMRRALTSHVLHEVGMMTANSFLDSDHEFRDKCLSEANFGLAVGGIQTEEVQKVMWYDRVWIPPTSRCDSTCFVMQLDRLSSKVARNVLARVAMLRSEHDFFDDQAMIKRLATFSRMASKPHFGKNSKKRFKSGLKHSKSFVQAPDIGRFEIASNSTFLQTLLHERVCSGDLYLCNLGEALRRHIVAVLHAVLTPGALNERSALRNVLTKAVDGSLSQPGQIWNEEIITKELFPEDHWMEEAQLVHREVLDSMEPQKRVVADMSSANNYIIEAFNVSNGRTLEIAVVMDMNKTRALSSTLLDLGYRSYIPFYGGHPFVRQAGTLRPTSGGLWQPLQATISKMGKRSDALDGSNHSTAAVPHVLTQKAAPVRSSWPINEAEWLRGARKDRSVPCFYAIDDRGHGPKRVIWQIRSGSASGDHLDSLGRPIMRAVMIDREHAPAMVWGDALPVRDSTFVQMRFSYPMAKLPPELKFNVSQPFNISDPSAGLIESNVRISIDEAVVTEVNVDADVFYKAAHGFRFGKALYVVDGVILAEELAKTAAKSIVKSVPGEAEPYSAEEYWKLYEPLTEQEIAEYSLKITRERAIQSMMEAGYEPRNGASSIEEQVQEYRNVRGQQLEVGTPGEGEVVVHMGSESSISFEEGSEIGSEAWNELLDAYAAEMGPVWAEEDAMFIAAEASTAAVDSASVEALEVGAAVVEDFFAGALGGIIGEVAAGPWGWAALGATLLVTAVQMLTDEKRCDHPARFTSTWDIAAQAMTGYQIPCNPEKTPINAGAFAQNLGHFAAKTLAARDSIPTSAISAPETPTTLETSTISGLTIIDDTSFILVGTSSSMAILAPVVTIGPTVTIVIDTGGQDGALSSSGNLFHTPTTTKAPITCPAQHYPAEFVGTKVTDAPCPIQTPYECTDDWFHKYVDKHLPDNVRNPNYCISGDLSGHYEAEKMGCLPDFGAKDIPHHPVKERRKRKKCHKKFLQSPSHRPKNKDDD